jgi:hypothetical protein
MTLDSDRSQVYAAEEAAFGGTLLEEVTTFEHLERLATRTMALAWWSGPVVPVVAARSDAGSSCARSSPDGVEIRLARPQWTPATLTHELAHVLAGLDAGHGPHFRRAHIDIVASALGHEAGCWLRDAYVACGLSVPPAERIVEPAAPTDGPIAL